MCSPTGGHFVCAYVTVGLRVQIWRWSVLCLHFFRNSRLNFSQGIWAISIVFRLKGSLTSVLICCGYSRPSLVFECRLLAWIFSYTCQLFLRYKREIFVLGVLGFPKIPEEVRSLPKTSEFCRRRSYRENAYPQGPTLVDNISTIVLKLESFGLTWSIVSSKTAKTHIFQSGVRNWPARVSRCEIEVFNP